MSNSAAGPSSKSKVGSSQPTETSFKRKRGVFQKELQHMMYGFGDDPNQRSSRTWNCLILGTILLLQPERLMKTWSDFGVLLLFQPLPESVALVEDIVAEYVTDLAHKAQDIGSKRGKLSVEDFLYLVRKDLPKLNRCTELLAMQEELKQARKAFDTDEEKLALLD